MTRRLPRLPLVAPALAFVLALSIAVGALTAVAAEAPLPLTCDAEFPGGNCLVERIDGDHIYLKQDPRDTAGFWFYWHCRVRGAAGRKVSLHFTGGDVLAARGPAVSTDGGDAWSWLGKEAVATGPVASSAENPQDKAATGPCFTYAVPPEVDEVRFCLAVPYVQSNFEQWLKPHRNSPHLKLEEHCKSKKGRSVERVRLGRLDGQPPYRVLITARHHACEMMANWAVEGLMDAVLAEGEEGRWFRENVEMLVLPFMDKDGVEDGDQGKNRRPYDHNRDYMGESIYPEVAALRAFVPEWSQAKLAIAFDMHCPFIRGGNNEQIVFVGNRSPEIWKRQQDFAALLQQTQTGPLVYDPKHNIPHGTGWNTLKEPRSCSAWSGSLPGVGLAGTWELPYASAGGKPVTAESARSFGADLARAIRQWLAGKREG